MEIQQAYEEYTRARTQAYQFHPIFRQYQRLAANKVLTHMKNNPFPFGEGTAASLIRKMPQRVLKQMPIGKIRNIASEFDAIVNEFIVQDIFSRNSRRDDGNIQTLWSIMETGMTFGWNTCTLYFTRVNGAYTVDYRSHYWADVFPAAGVRNINNGDVFIVDWWSQEDVKTLLKAAKEDTTINTAEVKLLLLDGPHSRDSNNQSEPNKQAAVQNLGYQVIRYYVKEDGKYMLYIFRPGADKFLQKKELPSRGHVTFYYSPDFQTAFGRSILGLIGGIQIDLDQNLYGKSKIREINLNPMLIVEGMPISQVQVKPGHMIQMQEGGKITPFDINSSSAENYNADHAAGQALIYQLAGYPEANTTSGVSGDTAIGKTPTAIKQAQSNIDNADNQVMYNLKLFLEQLFVESLKIYYANLPEAFIVEVSEEYTQRIASVAPERFIAPGQVLVENNLDLYDYEIDIESAKSDVDTLKLDSIMKMLGLLEQSPMLSARVAQLGIADDLIKEVIFASGLNNDQIAKKLSFLGSPNIGMMGQPGGDMLGGQPMPADMAMQMAGNAPEPNQNPPVQTQPPNPIRQQGVM
jgi:hypothetical protein